MEIIEFWSGCEWLPVELITKNTAIIKGISVNPEFGYDDMVLVDFEAKEISQVIKKNSQTFVLNYDIPYNDVDKNWSLIEKYFKTKKLNVHIHVPGIYLLSAPLALSRPDVEDIIENCPVKSYEINADDLLIDDEEGDDGDEMNQLF